MATHRALIKTDIEAWKSVAAFLLTGDKGWRKSLNKRDGFPASSRAEGARMQEISGRFQHVPGFLEALCQARDLPPPAYSDEQWSLLSKLFVTLRDATAQLKVVFAERNTVDFIEIGLAAEKVLERARRNTQASSPPNWHSPRVNNCATFWSTNSRTLRVASITC